MRRLFITLTFMLSGAGLWAQALHIIVDGAGGGDFTTIQAAINSVRDFKPGEGATIFIRNGVYNEKLVIPTYKCKLTLKGEDCQRTVITCNDYAALNGMGTFKTYTMMVSGNDITLENLTIQNTAGEVGQAVALHIEGDRVKIVGCRLLGNQDTVYTGREGARQYFEDCYIEGTTDFIFGPSTVWFERCKIHCKRDSYITAASTPAEYEVGYIFNDCDITVAGNVTSMYLGRPWRAWAMTLFMNCRLPREINPEGWENWRNPENEKTARYMEYNNSGPGAATGGRVKWAKQLTAAEAKKYVDSRKLFEFKPSHY